MRTFQRLVILATLCIDQSANSQSQAHGQKAPSPMPKNSSTPNTNLFDGTWVGTINTRTGNVEFTLMISDSGTVESDTTMVGRSGLRKATNDGKTMTWNWGIENKTVVTFTPNPDGKTAVMTLAGPAIREMSAFNSSAIFHSKSPPAAVIPAPPTDSFSPTALSQTEHHNLSPEGTFYLMEYVPVKTTSGVIGVLPGRRVKWTDKTVGDLPENIRVKTDDGTEFEVSTDKLTNDIDLGKWAGKRDAQSQQALADYMKEQKARYLAEKDRLNPIIGLQLNNADEKRAARSTLSGESKLDREAYHESKPWWWYGHPYIYKRR